MGLHNSTTSPYRSLRLGLSLQAPAGAGRLAGGAGGMQRCHKLANYCPSPPGHLSFSGQRSNTSWRTSRGAEPHGGGPQQSSDSMLPRSDCSKLPAWRNVDRSRACCVLRCNASVGAESGPCSPQRTFKRLSALQTVHCQALPEEGCCRAPDLKGALCANSCLTGHPGQLHGCT